MGNCFKFQFVGLYAPQTESDVLLRNVMFADANDVWLRHVMYAAARGK